jgi:hypothetical protein
MTRGGKVFPVLSKVPNDDYTLPILRHAVIIRINQARRDVVTDPCEPTKNTAKRIRVPLKCDSWHVFCEEEERFFVSKYTKVFVEQFSSRVVEPLAVTRFAPTLTRRSTNYPVAIWNVLVTKFNDASSLQLRLGEVSPIRGPNASVKFV